MMRTRGDQGPLQRYDPPKYVNGVKSPLYCPPPKHRYALCALPTPIEQHALPGLPEGMTIAVKRDDLTGGAELNGNKARKLEFLIADALQRGCTAVVSAGGTQSNHCRAVAAACARAGLRCHLVLRDDRLPGGGNLFLDQLFGATIEKHEKGTARQPLMDAAAARLEAEGCKPYQIPVGGSNALGAWGYLNASRELFDAGSLDGISDLALAVGSGGTIAGLALGLHVLSKNGFLKHPVKVWGYTVCDTVDEFYDVIQAIIDGVMVNPGTLKARDIVTLRCVAGPGYGQATPEVLEFVRGTARRGLLLDPTYTGKAACGLVRDISDGTLRPEAGVMFLHTGGANGALARFEEILPVGKST